MHNVRFLLHFFLFFAEKARVRDKKQIKVFMVQLGEGARTVNLSRDPQNLIKTFQNKTISLPVRKIEIIHYVDHF